MARQPYLVTGGRLLSASATTYECVQRLGQGGNSNVFLVIATSGQIRGVPFAAKIFKRRADDARRASFLQEIRLLKELDHPSIIRVYDEGLLFGIYPFVIAEYLPQTIGKLISAGTASVIQKLSYARQLLSAINVLAGLARILHRNY